MCSDHLSQDRSAVNANTSMPRLIAISLLLLEALCLLAIATSQPAWVVIPLTWTMIPVAQSLQAVTRIARGAGRRRRRVRPHQTDL
jgi:hypothetical protein